VRGFRRKRCSGAVDRPGDDYRPRRQLRHNLWQVGVRQNIGHADPEILRDFGETGGGFTMGGDFSDDEQRGKHEINEGRRKKAPGRGRPGGIRDALQEQRVKRDGFGQGHADNGLHEDLAGSTGVATNALNGFCSDETDANSGSKTAECALDTACEFSDVMDHDIISSLLVGWISAVRAVHAPGGKGSVRRLGVTVRFGMLVTVIADEADIDAHQQRENKCLNKANQQFEEVERNRQPPPRHRGHRMQ